MAQAPLFAGPALRRLRRARSLTQAAMAARLGISASYLNLIERNQRPVSARVLMQLIEQFDFDPRSLREDDRTGGLDGLARRFADERFADLAIDREEIDELLASAPSVAAAFARLYDASADAHSDAQSDALAESRREIERWQNHFSDLDHAAEALADELRLSRAEMVSALAQRLREKHQLTLRILPQEVMGDAIKRLDLHARQLQLSEMLGPQSRQFQIALQIAEIEQREQIANIAAAARFDSPGARELFERHLTGYFAAALLMPYGRFLRACESSAYDLTVLERRFGVSFEQLAHRLTTLQRVGQRGLPFFMARIDRAGQFSKRFSGASGATFLEGEASCPLWNIHRSFEQRGELKVMSIAVDGVECGPTHWFTMARTVEAAASPGSAVFAVVLGVETRFADQLAAARGIDLDAASATGVGPGCARCFRAACRQRSLPPRGAPLRIDRMTRALTPFVFSAPK